MDFKLSTESDRARILGYLNECFSLEGSVITWKDRPDYHFKSIRIARSWRAKWSGKPAGSIDSKGYRQIKIDGHLYLAHRVIWLMLHGEEPSEIDHIDGDKSNNHGINMRPATHQENMKNQKRYRTNKTGIMGVHWISRCGLWLVKISNERIGTYDSFLEACCSRKRAEKLHGFHLNHGAR